MSSNNRVAMSEDSNSPHLVFLPSGTGNPTPLLRLAAAMASRSCAVTFINLQPQAIDPHHHHPGVEVLDFQIPADHASSDCSDPFIARVTAINRELYQLNPILMKASAIIADFAVAATLARVSDDLGIPLYIASTTSAQFLALLANVPLLLSENSEVFSNSEREIELQGMPSIPKSSLPSAWLHNSSTNHLITDYLLPNAAALSRVRGVFSNTFDWFERETLARAAASLLPELFPVGPLPNYNKQKVDLLPWSSEKPAKSVVYVNFGSREVISPEQIVELGKGLEISGYHYLWVTHGNCSGAFDRFGDGKGMIMRGGIDQERILADPAIGLFVNQCEWQSIMQAAWEGVPMLAWPQHGDQKMNAEVVEKAGLGIRMNESESDRISIGQLVRQMMQDMKIKNAAKTVRERAREACKNGGSSHKTFNKFMQMFTTS